MASAPVRAPFTGIPSVYYASSEIDVDVATAWAALLDYPAWNPSFVGALVTPVAGRRGEEGEIVRISKPIVDPEGKPLPVFHAETVKVVPGRRLVWYVFDDPPTFRNFVDYGVTPVGERCRFDARYYGQNALVGEELARWREFQEASLDKGAAAFKRYCEDTLRT